MSAERTTADLIYLDNAATTPVRPEVAAEVAQVLAEDYGNPSSRHRAGLQAELHLRRARAVLSAALGARDEGVIFCSGGTEANALGLLGSARSGPRGGHVLVSAVEHPSILGCADMLARDGIEVEQVPVTRGGWVDPERAAAMARPETRLLALMMVNNESGVIQPVEQVIRAVKARAPGCVTLVDGVQAFTTIPLNLGQLGADMISVSSHKIQGPKGVGCLALAEGVRLRPLWGGGDQEGGRRPGTENVAGVAGFARAVELAGQESKDEGRGTRLLCALERSALAALPDSYAVGDAERRTDHILSIAVPSIPTEVLMNMLETRGVCVSSGSACHSRRSLGSHVMKAMGLPRDHGVVRFSLSHSTTWEEVQAAGEALLDLGLTRG